MVVDMEREKERERMYQKQLQDEEDKKRRGRILPKSEADYNLLMTDTVWGSEYINDELKDKVSQIVGYNDDGKITYNKEELWGLLGFYTRDMRLGNLNDTEINYCRYFLDLANDFLQVDMIKPFLICLSRVATVLEISQSKKGFLRKRMNTISTEHSMSEEPAKKSLFGMNKRRE